MGQRKKIKLEDIAKQLNISIVTVSNALNGRKGVSEKLREDVWKMAKDMGYQVSKKQDKKRERQDIIGIFVAEHYVRDISSFYMELYRKIAQQAGKKDCFLVLEVVSEEKEKLISGFEYPFGEEVTGIIVIGQMNKHYIEALRKSTKVPMICADSYDMWEDIDYVVINNFGGMEQMTQVLIDAGHKDMLFVGNIFANKNIMDRYMGFCKALDKNNLLDEEKDYIIKDRTDDNRIIQIELPEKLPTAFVCNCDKTANLLIEQLEKRNLSVPDDISIVGFDHFAMAINKDISLTTYENDTKALAKVCMNLLLNKIDGKADKVITRVVEGNIVLGNTVRKLERSE